VSRSVSSEHSVFLTDEHYEKSVTEVINGVIEQKDFVATGF
jgi:hypothetical protein